MAFVDFVNIKCYNYIITIIYTNYTSKLRITN